jgi:coenzyme PQQ biosynthesis protein PqqD
MTNPSRATTPGRHPSVLVQQVKPNEPSLVLLNPKSGEYYTLEAVGTRVWQLCDGKRTIAEIAATIAQEFDESPAIIENDVIELVKELMDEELVVPAG